ncbi:MAG TPA: lytic transglycosylase domain-containing protein [Gemmatimonadaceae bacterium]|nr:lytic transglycosylase domain-containing protein [Gemmatimonadaceae bacterium]
MKLSNYWKKRLRRDLPIIALGGVVAVGTVTRGDDAAPGQASRAVGAQLAYLKEIAPPETPTKPFAETALGANAMSDLDHRFVSNWVATFTGARKNDLETTLDRMEPYTPMIEKKLAERGMPKELVYLALIESGGNPKAKSPVGARGLWQFMAPTAKQYGLSSSERLDPVKATDAALDYLTDLHERFGSWYLAAAAYNTGQGRVSKVLKQVTGKSKGTDEDFYKIAARLPKETRDYVPKLVAVARIANAPEKYGFTD